MAQSKFKNGDLVEWKDAKLTGKVTHVSDYSISVEFSTWCGPKTFSFESDGRVWCWCRSPQIRKIVVPKKRRLAKGDDS